MSAVNRTITIDVPPEPAPRSVAVGADGYSYQRLHSRRDTRNWRSVLPAGIRSPEDQLVRCTWLELLAKGPVMVVWDPTEVPSRAQVLAKIDRRLAELFPRALDGDVPAAEEATDLLEQRAEILVIRVPVDGGEGPSGVPA